MARHGIVKQLSFIKGDLSFINSSPFAKLLDSCVFYKSLRDCRRVHGRIVKTHFSSEVFIQNKLIDTYWKCGCFDDARKLFDRMPERNVFTWNAVVSALTKLGFLDDAERVFDSMPVRDQCTWNSMIAGFTQHERHDKALIFFADMHKGDFLLNDYTFGSAISACSWLKDLKMGTQIHALVSKSIHSSNVFTGSALIDLYSKCGSVSCAQSVFDEMDDRNSFSWNSLITCYEQNGPANEALKVFVKMMDSGFEPDHITLASVASACASLSAIKEGSQIHARAVKFDKFRDDLIIGNALVDMYAKCGKINEARFLFDKMPIKNVISETSMVSGYAKVSSVKAARSMFTKMTERNIVSWNALIAGYTQNGENEEALGLFRQLKRESMSPSHYTFGNLLNACANLADLQLGRQAHSHVLKHGFRFQFGEESDIFVGNSLIDMYMKCGSVEDGRLIFDKMVDRDWVSWNATIVGYAQNGYGTKALQIFQKMLASGEKPDDVTMIGVLSACSHAGLVEEGRNYFSSMSDEFGLVPTKDHYSCLVDLLGRAGCLLEAKCLIETMPMQPDTIIWGSLLSACKIYRNFTLGKYVAEKLLEIDPTNSGPYVLLSNMYAENGKWADVTRVRKLMRKRGVVKQPGCSWIEIQGEVNSFMVKDKRHRKKTEMYSVLLMLTKQMRRGGYVPGFCDEEQSESESKSL
ncbi:hypothetical protein ACFE04_019193 [Oxalis oulophora]